MPATNDTSRTSIRNPAVRRDRNAAPLNGIYFAKVVDNRDATFSGKVKVFIPSLGFDETDTRSHKSVFWTSPFAGTTDHEAIGPDSEITDYRRSQKSYGMWMIPPDINNYVLVAFADGLSKQGYIISSIYKPGMHFMTPGMAAGDSFGNSDYPLPVSEVHKKSTRMSSNNKTRPLHADFSETLVKQGLALDPIRGAGSSSSRRESPSQVFGILTPGPRGSDPELSSELNYNHRSTGHQFVMDDNPKSRLVRLRTGKGHQLLMDDTAGVVYVINNTGTVWLEFTNDGEVYLFSEGSINLRAKKNFNLRADNDVNIEAGNNVNIRAAGNGPQGVSESDAESVGVVNPQTSGSSGKVKIEAAKDIEEIAEESIKLSSCDSVEIFAADKIAATTKRSGGVHVSTEGPFVVNSSQTSVDSDGFISLNASGQNYIRGSQVLLNSGAAPTQSVHKATKLNNIKKSTITDAGNQPPTFDKEAAHKGEPAVTSNGERTGEAIPIETIVPVLVTAEPFRGHTTVDSNELKGAPKGFSQSTLQNIPDFSTGVGKLPADAMTPDGAKIAVGAVDNSGAITATLDNNDLNFTKNLVNLPEQSRDYIIKSKGQITSNPVYKEVQNANSSFRFARDINLLSTNNMPGMLASIQAGSAFTSVPTEVSSFRGKVVGSTNKITGLSAITGQLAVGANNHLAELDTEKFSKFRATIANVALESTGFDELQSKLGSVGIKAIDDGPGVIYIDQSGNKIVDAVNGIGPIGNTLGTASKMITDFDNIKDMIAAPISENQALALTSFSGSIGEENFANSNVLDALNSGAYEAVPHLMQGWVTAPELSSPTDTVVNELKGQRQFEASVFQCPDNLDISAILPDNVVPGSIPYAQLADSLDSLRTNFLTGVSGVTGLSNTGLAPC